MVGAIVAQGDEIVGRGWHRRVGGPHAEVEALRSAGPRARGATLYVTLEPCNHHGRTPPCVDAVLEAGIARVIACHRDPNRVASGGFKRLQASGVEVEHGILADEAIRLNLRFLIPAVLGRPAITLKWAMSLDGRIATAAGESQWISSPSGRRWGLAQREEHDAILVGSGTVLADNPRLDRRLRLAGRPNVRVVLDRRLRTPPDARLFQVEGPVLIYTESTQVLEGAEIIRLPAVEPGAVLADLYQRGIRSVLVEGGGEVHASFVRSGLYDRVGIDCAPLLIGGRTAPGPLGGEGFPSLAGAARLEHIETRQRGGDVILMGYRKGCLRELLTSVG